MELRDYVRVLRTRWRLVAVCLLVSLASATVASLLTTAVYQSDAKLFVRASNADGSVGTAYTGSLFTQQRVKSYKEFVTSPTVTEVVAERLDIEGLTASAISAKLSADANLDTVNLNLHGKDQDPVIAQRITQAAAEVFRDYIGELEAPGNSVSPVALDIVLPASTAHQVAPRTELNLILGLLVGLAIGVGMAVLRELLDTRVKSPADMDDRFGLATLAVVAFDPAAKENPLIVQADPRSPRSEAFRRLRTNLQFVDVDRTPRSLVITSALEAEGKTTTACNLAIALAQADVPVVLLDGDLRRPSVAKYMGIEQAIGLTNVLIGHVALEDALQPWGSTGRLRVLPAGTLPPNPSELLGSQHMEQLVQALEEEALVIIDAPPLLPVTDGAILAATTSGALLVCRLGRTRREQIGHAVEALDKVGAHLYGTVLNMARSKGPDADNYGYGYYGKYVSSMPEVPPVRRMQPAAAGGVAVPGTSSPLPAVEGEPSDFAEHKSGSSPRQPPAGVNQPVAPPLVNERMTPPELPAYSLAPEREQAPTVTEPPVSRPTGDRPYPSSE